jgi:hypothetical protein
MNGTNLAITDTMRDGLGDPGDLVVIEIALTAATPYDAVARVCDSIRRCATRVRGGVDAVVGFIVGADLPVDDPRRQLILELSSTGAAVDIEIVDDVPSAKLRVKRYFLPPLGHIVVDDTLRGLGLDADDRRRLMGHD